MPTKMHSCSDSPVKTYQFRICYEDTDAGGIVYHAKYLGIAERARTESIRQLGGSVAELYRTHGLILVVRKMEIQYRQPLFLDDVVNVKTCLISVLKASCWLSQIFTKANERVTEIKLQLVCLKKRNYVPSPFPDNWKKIFAALSETQTS
ncbi:YbgC/FadM family acyl-CoA thioesterase [Commensalibacter sp. Nvir]|uniref:YbgC/FadM family acyl-CoA thioesterase n=1 Tax=Commensalibacter sp. Nvir TaxID=3069817 RepID=UPI0030C7EC25